MAIHLNNCTRLTTDIERLFIEAGGQNPDKALSKKELSEALCNTIAHLSESQSPSLIKLYRQFELAGEAPPITSFCENNDSFTKLVEKIYEN